MNGPPPLSLTLGLGRRERRLSIGIWALAGLVSGLQLGWWMTADGVLTSSPLTTVAAMVVGAVLGGGLGAWLVKPLSGRLLWDGSAWWLESPGHGGSTSPLHNLALCLDLGFAVVLQTPSGAWCVLSRSDLGPTWHGLQLALRLGRGVPAP